LLNNISNCTVLGMLGFEQLKTKAQSELSDKFNLKNFHQYILDMGPVQFDILFNNLMHGLKRKITLKMGCYLNTIVW